MNRTIMPGNYYQLLRTLMELHRDNNPSQYRIKSYQPGEIHINNKMFDHSLLVTPTEPAQRWRPQDISELNIDDIITLVGQQPDILLIGTGSQHHQIETRLLAPLYECKIGFEVMSSAAACRTFALLTTDNRKALAAVIIT